MMETKIIINSLRAYDKPCTVLLDVTAGMIADRLEKLESEKENLIHYNADLNNQLNKAESHIEKLEKQLSEKPEWISVEDRLPESEFVLCTDGEYCFVNIIPDMEDVREEGVTHWMPLPEPPKQKVPTFKDVFLKRFPGAVVLPKSGVPVVCAKQVFPQLGDDESPCDMCCAVCWNQPYFDEEGEADA